MRPKWLATVFILLGVLVAVFLAFRQPHRGSRPGSAFPETSGTPSAPSTAPILSAEHPFYGSLDCEGLAPAPPVACPVRSDAFAELVRAANGFSMAPGVCAQTAELMTESSVQQALGAVDRAAADEWSARSFAERVIAQNAALRLAICSTLRDQQVVVRELVPVLRRHAAQLVHQLAPSRHDLAGLGSVASPEISQWIGDPNTWRDLRPPHGFIGFHERGYGLTKAVRTMIVGNALVNLGQLVAIDDEWQPHITPFVGSLEVRRPLESPEATLCAASLDIDWLACGAPAGLRPFGEGAARIDPQANIVFRTDHMMGHCRVCHIRLGTPQGLAVAPGTELSVLATRRENFLRELTTYISAIRRP